MENTRIKGDWAFTLRGDTLTGTLITRDDNLLVRKISVKRKPASK